MENKKLIALVAPLAVVNAATIALAIGLSTKTLSAFDHMEPNTNIVITDDDTTTPDEPDVPVTPDDPTTPDEPDTPEDPEEPGDPETPETPEEPEEPEVPTISLDIIYNFNDIRELLMTYEELNGSYCTMKIRCAGYPFGTPGFYFFTDVSEDPITNSSQLDQKKQSECLAREDAGNNNVNFVRGEVVTLSGVVEYTHSSYLGVDLVIIK